MEWYIEIININVEEILRNKRCFFDMEYPYCNEKMIKGYIYGDRYVLKWLP